MKPLAIANKAVPRARHLATMDRPPRTIAFARAIAKRYGRMGGVVRRLDLILERRTRQDVSLVYRQGDRISNVLSWTGRFFLRAGASTTPAKGIAARQATEVLKLSVTGQGAVALSVHSTAGKSAAIAKLVDRIASRRVRVDSADREQATAKRSPTQRGAATSAHDLREPEPRRIELPVVSPRRNSLAANSRQPAAIESLAPRSDTRQVRGSDDKTAVLPLADREVERIADRVIGSLDRRIVAQRERMGRI